MAAEQKKKYKQKIKITFKKYMKEKRKRKKNGVLIDLCLPTGTKTQDRFLMCGTSGYLKRSNPDGT